MFLDKIQGILQRACTCTVHT